MEKKVSKENPIIAYKALDKNLRYCDFQYEIGNDYHMDDRKNIRSGGFKAYENPIDIFYHHGMFSSRFVKVELWGTIEYDPINKYMRASDIKVVSEVNLSEMLCIGSGIVKDRILSSIDVGEIKQIEGSSDGNGIRKENGQITCIDSCAAISNNEDKMRVVSIGEFCNMSSSGDYGYTYSNGEDAQIASSGDYGYIYSNGEDAQIASSGEGAYIFLEGEESKVASSGEDVKICVACDGTQIASSGDYAKISTKGDDSIISSSSYKSNIVSDGKGSVIGSLGPCSKVVSFGDESRIVSCGNMDSVFSNGTNSVVVCTGNGAIAKSKKGSWIVLTEWKHDDDKGVYTPICVKAEYVDGEKIKEDTWYTLKDGEFKEDTIGDLSD